MPATQVENITGSAATVTGTGPFTIGAALKYHRGIAAVLPNNAVRTFFATDPAGTDFMLFIGTYSTTGTSLAVTTVLHSSNGGTSLVTWPNPNVEISVVASKTELTQVRQFQYVADLALFNGAAVGDLVCVQHYSATALSGQLNFVAIADGTGGTVNDGSLVQGVGIRWRQLFPASGVSVESFGAPGYQLGLGDANALQNAIDYVDSIGGGTVTIGSSLFLAQAVTVKPGVTLRGEMEHAGYWKADTDQQGSLLSVNAGLTITLNGGGAIAGLRIQKFGVANPQNRTQANAWTDTAITLPTAGAGSSGAMIKDCYILGFLRAIDAGAGGSTARVQIDNVYIDCRNGVRITGSVDQDRLIGIHCWPFLSDGGVVTNTWRDGVGIELIGAGSWARLEHCFVFGYQTGFKLNGTTNISMSSCGIDSMSPTDNVVGVELVGNALATKIDNMDIGGEYDIGIKLNMTPVPDPAGLEYCAVQITGCKFGGGNASKHVEILNAGRVAVTGCVISGGVDGIVMGANVACRVSLSGNQFNAQSSNPIANAAGSYTNPIWCIDNSNSFTKVVAGTGLWTNAIDQAKTLTIAATLYLEPDYSVFNFTGTATAVTAIHNSWPGRIVVLRNVSGATQTFTQGGSINLKTGASVTVPVGDHIAFYCSGYSWSEL